MSCGITIQSVVADPISGDVFVSGTYSGSGQRKVNITVTCGSQTSFGGDGITPGVAWTITVPNAGCACGQPVTVTVIDPQDPNCTVTFTANDLCCCPSGATFTTPGVCSGTSQLVTFDTTVTIPTACSYDVQRDYGDGSQGTLITLTGPGTFPLPPDPHTYSVGTYTSTFDVVSPAGCGLIDSTTVSVTCGCPGGSFKAAICQLLEFLILFFGSAGLVLTIAFPIGSIATTAGTIAVVVLALALFALFRCDQCVCDSSNKLLAQIFFIAGINLVMFVPPNPSPVVGGVAFALAVLFMGIGWSMLQTWYNTNKPICPLNICDFLCTIAGRWNTRSCTNISVLVTFYLYFVTFAGNVPTLSPLGLFFALILATIIAAIVWYQLKHTPPCNNNSGVCQ